MNTWGSTNGLWISRLVISRTPTRHFNYTNTGEFNRESLGTFLWLQELTIWVYQKRLTSKDNIQYRQANCEHEQDMI